MSRAYVDRLTADYRKTFGTTSGKHVLMDLYTRTGAHTTSYPMKSNSELEMAFNEGKRFVWIAIMGHLNRNDVDNRELHKLHMDERKREEAS